MRLYLDDDSASDLLVKFLCGAGHDVQIPADVGRSGRPDPVHLIHAIESSRTLLTMNYGDFEMLNQLIRAAEGHHPGILVVRKDNDARRDMTVRGIVNAIARLSESGEKLDDQLIPINRWR